VCGKQLAYGFSIKRSVSLYSWPLDCRAFFAIKQSELYRRSVCRSADQAVQGVDFSHKVTFSEAANRGVTRHRSDGCEFLGD
jgi:hypothetical protein